MPMTICTKTVPVCVASPNMQSQLPLEMELAQTFERLRHIHSQATEPAVCPAYTHRPMVPHLTAIGPDQACLPASLPLPSHPCEYSSSSSSSCSSVSSSMSSWSKSGSPRQKKGVVFADSVGLPLVEVRVFTCDPPVEAPLPCSGTLKRGQRSLAVRGKMCPPHSTPTKVAQPAADFPAFPAARPQDNRTLQAHNDTLRRVNIGCQRVSPHTKPKAHTQATGHTHATVHTHTPPEYAQAMMHTPQHMTAHTQQRFTHTLPKAHTHASLQRQACQPHSSPTKVPQPGADYPAFTARPQDNRTLQAPSAAYTHEFAHTFPKAFTRAPGGPQSTPQRAPSCGHSVMASRQPPPVTAWPPSRSPQPQPNCPRQLQDFAGQNWVWHEGMAVH